MDTAIDRDLPALDQLRGELTAYYQQYDARSEQAIRARMDAEAAAHPSLSPLQWKARLHAVIAAEAEPVCFHHTPFAFECGVRPGPSWGMTGVGTWMRDHFASLYTRNGADARLQCYSQAAISNFYNPVDYDHHNIGYDLVLEKGLAGLITDAEERCAQTTDVGARDFYTAAAASLRAVLRLVARFADGYAALAERETEPELAAQWQRAAAAIRWTPVNPPRTFYEALLCLSAVRELFATFEGVGISTLGHLDRHLYPYYAADLQAGRLSEAEAADLLGRYLLLTDLRFGVRHSGWAETSTTMTLGGCDAEGTPLYNDLTRLILRLHQECGLLNPKPQCRVSARSDPRYLQELGAMVAAGRNTLAVFNDDVLIPAQQAMGKRLEDCRLYVNGGCQEPILLGREHSSGAHWYFNLPRVFELTMRPDLLRGEWELPIIPLRRTAGFEDVYQAVMANLGAVLAAQTALERERGAAWPEVNPCPLISSTLADCTTRGKDYTSGGARYAPTAICFVGFATLVDSLNAIRLAVFERGLCRLEELLAALATDYKGNEGLLAALRGLPHFGQDDAETDLFTARVAHDLAVLCRGQRNERGGPFQPAMFSYANFLHMGAVVGATPDGRRAGEPLSQGANPSRLAKVPSAAHLLASLRRVDYRDYPAVAVFDLQLPCMREHTRSDAAYTALLESFIRQGCPTVQCSLVDTRTLRDAQEHPEQHRDLVVRVAGFSAYFVTLERQYQDEFINRPQFNTP